MSVRYFYIYLVIEIVSILPFSKLSILAFFTYQVAKFSLKNALWKDFVQTNYNNGIVGGHITYGTSACRRHNERRPYA